MMQHKSGFLKLSTAELLARRQALSFPLQRAEQVILGSLVEQFRRCGKPGCRCAAGAPHGPYAYITPRPGRGMRYVPAGLLPTVLGCLSLGQQAETALAEISAINVELLARRELSDHAPLE